MEAAGLVRTEREGRYKFHYLELAPLAEIQERWPSDEREGTSAERAETSAAREEESP